MNKLLAEKLKTLPSAPGVYFHKNADGEIIYVGKAAVLKNRVRQYFQNTEKDPKTEALVSEIVMTDWLVVDTEMDALFLESEMIKRYRPKWNILLRDDKTVCYVRINLKSDIPYVSLTSIPEDDKAEYIGPFYSRNTINKALRVLRKVFPYYTKPYSGKKTLETDLGLTPGIEVNRRTPQEYKKDLRKLIRYLNGERKTLLKELDRQMRESAKNQEFESAALFRNQIYGLQGIRKKIIFSDKEFISLSSDGALRELKELLGLPKTPRKIEGYDISHQSGIDVVASMVVFINGVADRSKYRKFKLRKQQNNDPASMKEVIERRLKHQEWEYPDVIILDGSIPQLSVTTNILLYHNIPVIARDKSGDHAKNANTKIIIPVKNEENIQYHQIKLSPNSHLAKLIARIDEESHRFAVTYHRLLKTKNMLK